MDRRSGRRLDPLVGIPDEEAEEVHDPFAPALRRPCSRCSAVAGEPCRFLLDAVPVGSPKRIPHRARRQAAGLRV